MGRVQDFEHPFLQASRGYFTTRGNEWAALPSNEYCRLVSGLIEAEEGRVHAMMHINTKAKLMTELDRTMISPHVDTIINKESSGLLALLRRGPDSEGEIATMYRVLSRVPEGAHKMAVVIKRYIDEVVSGAPRRQLYVDSPQSHASPHRSRHRCRAPRCWRSGRGGTGRYSPKRRAAARVQARATVRVAARVVTRRRQRAQQRARAVRRVRVAPPKPRR